MPANGRLDLTRRLKG